MHASIAKTIKRPISLFQFMNFLLMVELENSILLPIAGCFCNRSKTSRHIRTESPWLLPTPIAAFFTGRRIFQIQFADTLNGLPDALPGNSQRHPHIALAWFAEPVALE